MKRSIMCVVALMLCLCMLIPANMLTADATQTFYSEATTLAIKNHIENDAKLDKSATAQGACTDGKYAYFAINSGSTTILKYDVNTWELKKKSNKLALDHANDLTYNSKDNVIVVANNSPNYDTITLVDPDTLTVLSTQKIKYKIYSISYNETYNRYVVGLSGTYNFAILDSSFKEIKNYKGYNSGFLRQGADCDDDYLYFVQSGGGGNLIVIYNWSGKLVDTVSVDKSLEIENIFHIGNTFYTTLHYYGNYIYRIGISDKTAIKFTITFDSNGGKGEMEPLTVYYGKDKKLPKCTFEKENYFFAGWIIKRNSYNKYYGKQTPYSKSDWLSEKDIYEYTLYGDATNVSKTTKVGNITATAFWIAKEYTVSYDANGGEGTLPTQTVGYDEVFKLSESNMRKTGYIFTGWTAQREYDGKIYGYTEKAENPAWLYEKHVYKPYIFTEGQEVSALTYDKGVTFRAKWQLAFSFSKDGTTLDKYIGVDENVVFPETETEVTSIADEAFAENTVICSVTIPTTIDNVGKDVFRDCSNLSNIYFDHTLPKNVEKSAFKSPLLKKCFLLTDSSDIFLGFYTGSYSYDMFINEFNDFFL